MQGEAIGIKLLKKPFPFRKRREKARGTVQAFVLPSKPICHVTHRNSTVSSTACRPTVLSMHWFPMLTVYAKLSVCVCERDVPLSLSPAVWHWQSSSDASDVVKFLHNKAWERLFVLMAWNVGSRLGSKLQIKIDLFPKIETSTAEFYLWLSKLG